MDRLKTQDEAKKDFAIEYFESKIDSDDSDESILKDIENFIDTAFEDLDNYVITNEILTHIVLYTYKNNKETLLSGILKLWKDSLLDDSKFVLLVIMYMYNKEESGSNFILDVFKDMYKDELFDQVIKEINNEETYPILKFIDMTYSDTDEIFTVVKYREKYVNSIDMSNTEAIRYFKDVLDEISPFAKIPDHILSVDPLNNKPYTSEYPYGRITLEQLIDKKLKPLNEKVKILILSKEEIIEHLIDNPLLSFNSKEDRKKSKKILENKLNDMNPDDLERYIQDMSININRQKLIEDVNYFRVLGPSNVMTDRLMNTDDNCSKYGGCRMSLCNCFEGYDQYTDIIDEDADWFDTGRCQVCSLSIMSRSHAIRKPVIDGGWRGIYCSWDCLILDIDNDPFRNFESDEKYNIMGTNMKNNISKYGIYDTLEKNTNFLEMIEMTEKIEMIEKTEGEQGREGDDWEVGKEGGEGEQGREGDVEGDVEMNEEEKMLLEKFNLNYKQ